ncbi:uncharacterized protein HGUI_00215 [Hanseniaspora guilliermondii]|uniref:PUM-HD domain-containing protein n=1 Tax=Hanseniaspora guilliermondii TaxID=56406 RepID=A0A1L0CTF0_9ASCO|nr:uncharacterized protein HGUI_00215 [Hanseniaspora guilliermondii]
MVVQSKNDIIPTSSGDSNDEFFEANSSFNLNVIDDKNESSILDSKLNKDFTVTSIEDHHLNKVNLKNKKSLQNVRKNSSTSNQSSFSFSSNKEGLNDNQQKKTKKSSSSSTFSKIQMFRDRSNTKKSNASSDAVLTDTTTNMHMDIKGKMNIQEQNIIEDEELYAYQSIDSKTNKNNANTSNVTNDDSYLAPNGDTTFSDVNNYSMKTSEEKGELSSPALSTTLNEELDASSKKNSTQKNSSKYRSGKFSSTITSFLPSISAKLHHNKNKNQGEGGSSQPPTPSADNSKFPDDKLFILSSNSPHKEKPVNKIDHNSDIEQKQMTNNSVNDQISSTKYKILSMMGSSKKQNVLTGKTYDTNTTRGPKTSPNMIKTDFMSSTYSSQPIPFPNENSMLHNIPTNHSGYHQLGVNQDSSMMNNSLYMNRPRADTVSSQITSLSNVPSYSVWSNMGANTQDASSFQYDTASIMSSNMVQQQQLGYNIGGYGTNTTNTNWRPRSKSNVSMVNDLNGYQHYANSVYTNNVDTLSYQKSHQVSVKNILPQLESGESMKIAPILQDDVDHSSFNWVTNYSYAPKINHLPNIIQPTDTICVSNIFSLQKTQSFPTCFNLTSYALHGVFHQFGEILSIRTLYGLNVALIEFKSVESAKMAHDVMHGQVISTSIPSEVYYAQIIPLPVSMESDSQGSTKSLLTEQLYNGNLRFVEHGQWTIPVLNGYIPAQKDSILTEIKNTVNSQGNSNEIVIEQEHCPFALPPPNLNGNKRNIEHIFKYFQTQNNSVKGDNHSVKKAMDKVLEVLSNEDLSTDPTNYGPQPNANGNSTTLANGTRKIFDSPTLRDLRKALDNKNISTIEVEQICVCMLDEIAELCSDYLGNTIIQRIYDISSPLLKNLIVENCAQYLTSISVHKNGTWAAQKLITGSSEIVNNKISIVEGIKPYCLPLFTDQFGNYVIQCCLKYGPPYNSFIYDNILKNFWEIVQSRFGSRAVRAVLETSNLEDEKLSEKGDKEEVERCKIMTRKQLYSITSLVVVYSEYLATNSNGTLLLTWYLDTCTIPNRLEILSKQLSKNIVLLATHKLASLTLLKLLNHRKDDGNSKALILNSIFGDLSVSFEKVKSSLANSNLLKILKEAHGNGTQFILKVLSLSLIDMKYKQRAISRLHDILTSTESEYKEAVDMMKKDKKMVEELSLGTTSVHSHDESSGVSSTGKRTRALSHVFNDSSSDVLNGNSGSVHARNTSIGSTNSNTTSTNGGGRKNRGHSITQRNHGNNSKGSLWD